tara:strand:- start:270 stop:473 length:204 start_codon:yes stop_codon:yes gene_type:complete
MNELQECKVLIDEINESGDANDCAIEGARSAGARKSPFSLISAYLKLTSKGKWVHSDFGKSSKLTTM